MPDSYFQILRDCARTAGEKSFATGLRLWDKSHPDCIRLAARLKKRGINIDTKAHQNAKNSKP